jgi:hypothetical protein
MAATANENTNVNCIFEFLLLLLFLFTFIRVIIDFKNGKKYPDVPDIKKEIRKKDEKLSQTVD